MLKSNEFNKMLMFQMQEELNSDEKKFMQFCKNPEILKKMDAKLVQEFAQAVEKNIGNMKFNKKLANKEISKAFDKKTIKNARYFLFKTKNFKKSNQSINKLDILLKNDKETKKISKSEKLSVQEYGYVKNFTDIKKWTNALNLLAQKSNNKEIEKLSTNITRAYKLNENLQNLVSKNSMGLRSGDIAMYKTEKKWSMKGKKGAWLGHEGRLEKMLLTEYNHAAPIITLSNNKNQKTAHFSHVWDTERTDTVLLDELIQSDIYRMDVSKLVSPAKAKQLEQVNYGTKTDEKGKEIKVKWQDVMQDRFEKLTEALHAEQSNNKLFTLEEQYNNLENEFKVNRKILQKMENKYNQNIEFLKQTKQTPNNKILLKKTRLEMKNLREEYKLLTKKQEKIDEKSQEIEKEVETVSKKIITNDGERLESIKHWIGPKAAIEGHKSSKDKNDLRDISNRMFHADTEEKKMLCSEYAIKSQLSAIDQLNKITSYDLIMANIIDKEENIIKNPVSKKERLDKVHPGQLVKLMKQTGAVKRVKTEAERFINTEELKAKSLSKDYVKPLSDKIYSVLKNSASQKEFKEKATKATNNYLNSYQVDDKTKTNVKKQILDQGLNEIYNKYQEKPKGIKEKIKDVCTKVLVFCKIIKKDQAIRQDIKTKLEAAPKIKKKINPTFAKAAEIGEKLRKTLAKKFGKAPKIKKTTHKIKKNSQRSI